MVKTVWARNATGKQLYLVDHACEFILPVKRYLDYLTALEKSPHTRENYCRHLCYYFTFLEQSHLDWRSVTPDDLVHFVQWLRNPLRQVGVQPLHEVSPLSERSVNTIVTAVSSFYRYQIQRGERLDNPVLYEQISNCFSGFKSFLVHISRGKTTRRVVRLKEPEKRIKTVRDTDFETFLHAIDDNLQFRCIVLLMREGGLRVGEVLGLFIQDLQFHRNGIWIRRRSGLENGALAKSLTEGEERFIDLSPELMALLDQLLLHHTFDTDHLFVVRKSNARDKWGNSTYGHPLDREAVKGLFRYYSRKSGIPVHAHLLRHSHATELRKAAPLRFTKPQERIWAVLQAEEHRVLPIRTICEMAGYRSIQVWYHVMKDEAFRAQVEALGVITRRQGIPLRFQPVVPLTTNVEEEWQQDVIDIRRFVTEYPKHWPASCFKLDFSCVRNFHMRWLVKRYFRARLGFWEPRSFKGMLGDMKPFFFALGKAYPELESFAPLTREMIEPLLVQPSWVDSRGCARPISADKKLRMVTSLSVMFTYMQRHEWEGAPSHMLIYEEDRPQRIKKRPRPLPQSVFEQLQMHAHDLPPYARNLVEILSVAGLRAEDALHLPEDCLEYDAAGDPRLSWYNHKMKRDGRPLPVTTSVAEAIERQRELVQDVPDHFRKRYLFRTPLGVSTSLPGSATTSISLQKRFRSLEQISRFIASNPMSSGIWSEPQ